MNGRYSQVGLTDRKAVVRAVVQPLLEGKRDRTVLSFYARTSPGSDGRVRTILAPRTSSFRLASSESDTDEASTNLQNQPKKVARMDELYRVRDLFVADEDMVLLAGDFRNAEGILCAAYSLDWDFYDQMMNEMDVHTMHAQYYFKTEEISPLQRDIAKMIHYASLYMAGAETITRNVNRDSDKFGRTFTIEEVADIRAMFLSLHTLEQWWHDVKNLLKLNGGWLRNALGARRVFHDPDDHNRLKDGLSFFPQSTVACLMNNAMTETHRRFDKPGKQELLLQIHDEMLWQTHRDNAEALARSITPYMERTFKIEGREVYVPVEWKVGNPWGGMEELKL